MRNIVILTISFICFACSSPIDAGETPKTVDCMDNAISQFEMNKCAASKFPWRMRR